MNLKEFGRVWMSSSPLTGEFSAIKHAIDAGVDAIVLKSATTIAKPGPKQGKRTILSGEEEWIDGEFIYDVKDVPGYGQSVYCVSTHKDIEMLSFGEANRLYDQIRKYSRRVKVIPSFAPVTLEDITRVDELNGDAVEINTRWFKMDVKKPYIASIYLPKNFDPNSLKPQGSRHWQKALEVLSPKEIIEDCLRQHEVYEKEKKRKFEQFKQMLSLVPRQRPILLKVARQYFEMNSTDYFKLPADGFTFSDSEKNGVMTSLSGIQIDVFGKGSICGEPLQQMTIAFANLLRNQNPEMYISASGGIIDATSARRCLEAGANSIQLCSAVYLGKFTRVEEIVNAVK